MKSKSENKSAAETKAGSKKKPADSPDRDEHHDESRRNGFDPKVAKQIKGGKKS